MASLCPLCWIRPLLSWGGRVIPHYLVSSVASARREIPVDRAALAMDFGIGLRAAHRLVAEGTAKRQGHVETSAALLEATEDRRLKGKAMPPRDVLDEKPERLLALFKEIQHTTDRVAAISATAFLDNSLGAALSARFVRLGEDWEDRIFSGQGAPLGTLSAKIAMGYALGLYGPQTRADLDLIRSVRNDFAHTPDPIFFADKRIAAKCKKLTSPERLDKDPIYRGFGMPFDLSNPRERFIYAARSIATEVVLRVRERRPSYRSAPTRPVPPDSLP